MKAFLAVIACFLAIELVASDVSRAQSSQPVTFTADPSGQINFVVSALNLGCTFTPKGGTAVYKPAGGGPELSCDQTEPRYVRVVLTEKRLLRYDKVGDQGCCSVENVLKPGVMWTQGPFTCKASDAGLTCKRRDGRGFSVSKAKITLR